MSDKKRYPTLCSWCENSFVGKDQTHHCQKGEYNENYSTVCICGYFELDGKDNYPDKAECPDYKIDPDVTAIDIAWWPIAWAASEVNRLEIKDAMIRISKII